MKVTNWSEALFTSVILGMSMDQRTSRSESDHDRWSHVAVDSPRRWVLQCVQSVVNGSHRSVRAGSTLRELHAISVVLPNRPFVRLSVPCHLYRCVSCFQCLPTRGSLTLSLIPTSLQSDQRMLCQHMPHSIGYGLLRR